MPKKDPYKGSPYDAAGMPLSAETVDYDKKEDVAQHTVVDKYEAPTPLFSDDDDFHEKKLKRTKFNAALQNTAIQAPGHKVHKKFEDHLGTNLPVEPHTVDLEDPGNAREEIVRDSIAKGFDDVPKLPEVAKQEDVDNVLKDEHNTSNVSDKDKDKIVEEQNVEADTLITTAEGTKAEEDVNTLDRHNDPADPDFMKLLKGTDNDTK